MLRHKREDCNGNKQVRPHIYLTLYSPEIGPNLKIRLYTVAVCSLMTWGCESWTLTDKVMRRINGGNRNSQMLSRITGNDVRHEARSCTTSFDILKHIRTMRLKWFGTILRQERGGNRMLLRSVEMQSIMNQPGNLLSDAPTSTT